jgi:hypothetical protein
MIERDYHYALFVDNLPSAYVTNESNEPIHWERGIPVGYLDS